MGQQPHHGDHPPTACITPRDNIVSVISLVHSTQVRVNGCDWVDNNATVSFTVEPCDPRYSANNRLRELASIRARSEFVDRLFDETASMANRWSILGAFIPKQEDGGGGGLFTKVGVFEGNEWVAESVYAPLLALQSALAGWTCLSAVRAMMGEPIYRAQLERMNEPVPYGTEHFVDIQNNARAHGWISNGDNMGVCVEFPWWEGEKTSLMVMKEHDHPMFGMGLRCTLELPISPDEEGVEKFATSLNLWELRTPDLPPLFGAWCVGPRAVTFNTFVPNHECGPDIPYALYGWTLARSRRVSTLLNDIAREESGEA